MSDPADRDEVGNLGPAEYLAYRVLSERHQQDNLETGRTRFHKLCCLTDRRLHDEHGRDVGLPKYWYKYGRTIDEASLNGAVFFGPSGNHIDGRAYYPADQISESDFDHLNENLKDDITEAASHVVDEHGEKDSRELERFQYDNHAPNEFVEAYANLRWHLAALVATGDSDQTRFGEFQSDGERRHIEMLLDEMLVAFDRDRYDDIADLYLIWDDTIRLLDERGASPRELKEFTEEFIEAISKVDLRFEANAHVPDERLSDWAAEREDVLRDLEHTIERKRRDALEDRPSSDALDAVAESYNETISTQIEEF